MRKQILTLILLFLGLTSFSQTSDCYSAKFDGLGTYYQYPSIGSNPTWDMKNVTIESWIRLVDDPNDYDLYQILINYVNSTSTQNKEFLSIKRDTLFGRIGTGIVKYPYPNDSLWHHVALVRNNNLSTLTLFLDGISVNVDNVSPVTSLNTTIKLRAGGANIFYPTDTLGLGCFPGSSPSFFNGNMSKLRVTLSSLYINNFSTDCSYDTITNMKLLYSFSEGTDSSRRYTSTTAYTNISLSGGYSFQGPCINTIFNSHTACTSYTWPINGQTYTTNGTYQNATVSCSQSNVLFLSILPATTSQTVSSCNTFTWSLNGQTYTNSGIYTYTVAGCQVNTLNLTILPGLVIDTVITCSSNPGSICYTWPFNGQQFATSADVTVTVGCQTGKLHLVVNTSLNDTVSKTSNSLKSECDGCSYKWVKCPISTSSITLSTSQIFNPTSSSNYAVIISNGTCIDTSLCVSWAPVGVNDISTTNFEIYPNPVNNLLNISSSVNINSVSITNIVGQTMFINKYNNTNKLVLDMSKFEKGVYFVKVNNSINKILKQ